MIWLCRFQLPPARLPNHIRQQIVTFTLNEKCREGKFAWKYQTNKQTKPHVWTLISHFMDIIFFFFAPSADVLLSWLQQHLTDAWTRLGVHGREPEAGTPKATVKMAIKGIVHSNIDESMEFVQQRLRW